MYIIFHNPPSVLLASGTKEGVEIGGSKSLISLSTTEKALNIYTEENIYNEMSWAEFYQEEGLEDQINSFTTTKFDSVREDPDALIRRIVESLKNIIKEEKLFYGIADFEVDAFMNPNTVIPGLKLESELINKLMDSHKKIRDENLFPKLIKDVYGDNSIRISFQGMRKNYLDFSDKSIGYIADKLRTAKGFATGVICASKTAANFFIMNDRIIFKEGIIPRFYIDRDSITIIERGVQRTVLFPISWFRIDIGIKSLETLELWSTIQDNLELKNSLNEYDKYLIQLIIKKYKEYIKELKSGKEIEGITMKLNESQRKRAVNKISKKIKDLKKEAKN